MLLVFLDYTSPLPCSKITQNVAPSYQAREMEMEIQTWAVFSVVRKHAIEIEGSAVNPAGARGLLNFHYVTRVND